MGLLFACLWLRTDDIDRFTVMDVHVYATMVYEYVNVESIRHELWQPIGKFIDVLIRSAIPTKQVNRAGLYLCFKFLRGGGKLNFVLNVGPTMFTRDIQGKRGQTVR
jgi:hypothetical protein